VNEGTPQTSQQVRASYNRLRPLEKTTGRKARPDPRRASSGPIDYPTRIVVLSERSESKDLSATGKLEFTLADVYAHAAALAKLHPNNAHVRDKIRQQLQVLRDLGLLEFLGSGSYRLP
jgi:Dam-replacing HTH domain